MCLLLSERRDLCETTTVNFTKEQNAAQCAPVLSVHVFMRVYNSSSSSSQWPNLLAVFDLMEIATDR